MTRESVRGASGAALLERRLFGASAADAAPRPSLDRQLRSRASPRHCRRARRRSATSRTARRSGPRRDAPPPPPPPTRHRRRGEGSGSAAGAPHRGHDCERQRRAAPLQREDVADVELEVGGAGGQLRRELHLDPRVAQPLAQPARDQHKAAPAAADSRHAGGLNLASLASSSGRAPRPRRAKREVVGCGSHVSKIGSGPGQG